MNASVPVCKHDIAGPCWQCHALIVTDLEAENARLQEKLEKVRALRDSSVLDMNVLDRILEGECDE